VANTGERYDYPPAIYLRRHPRGWSGDMAWVSLSSRDHLRAERRHNGWNLGRQVYPRIHVIDALLQNSMNMKTSRLALLLLLASAVSSYATQDNLPPNFSGDDPATLFRQLADLRKRLVKNESETTPAYEARITEEKKKPIIGSRAIEDTFNLVTDTVKAEYDLDTEIMRFTLPVQTNDQGAKYQVSLGGDNDPHVLFNSAVGLSGSVNDQKFTATAKLNVEEAARRLKTGTKAVLVVRFEEPYVEGRQFVSRIVGLQFFDQQTGRVLSQTGSTETAAQIKQAAAPSAPDYSTYHKNPSFKPPRILSKPDPRYTEEARRHNVNGSVLLYVMLSETGQITQISVAKGLPYGLTERAIAAARLIRFEPAELNGKKVAYPVAVVYRFDLF
jgi:TonB family protein